MPIYTHNNAAVAALANALDADPLSAAQLPAVMGDRLYELLELRDESKRVQDLEDEIKDAASEVRGLEARLLRATNQHREEVELIAKQSARIAELEAQLADLRDNVGYLQEKLADVKIEADNLRNGGDGL